MKPGLLKMKRFMLFKGLKGFEHVNFEVDARSADANAEARELADGAFLKER
jgi:hypothetical protein